jgi:hypothetical protein
MEHPATYNGCPWTLLATEVVNLHSTPPSTTMATPSKLVARRRRQNKQMESREHVTKRSIDWKMVDYIFEPMHARFEFTLEGRADDEGLNSHGDLLHFSPSDCILERDLSKERMFINPPWSWPNISVVTSRVVGVLLRHLR